MDAPAGPVPPSATLDPVSTSGQRPPGRWWWPVLADLLCVLALAVGGRRAHEPGEAVSVLLTIGWPFAVAAVLAHALLLLAGRPTGRLWPEGGAVLLATYVVGMALRGLSGRGLAPAFLLVALGFLALTMLGWRGVRRMTSRRSAS
ncbi:DUF3054 domain-containing protein [Nocardioides silvaticus]|uniref:DUF3054 domain-containing protein n=1 Tax=Nocardioides silvaticus TaxID=2201891 RepID=A0A316TFE4_9ACTN|nr:DUF3054 domain-containing protein [Nocardioides silvaticus]